MPRLGQNPPEQDLVHPAAETLFAVDQYHGHAVVILLAESRIFIDVDQLRSEAVPHQQLLGFFTQVAAGAGINDYLMSGHDSSHFWKGGSGTQRITPSGA